MTMKPMSEVFKLPLVFHDWNEGAAPPRCFGILSDADPYEPSHLHVSIRDVHREEGWDIAKTRAQNIARAANAHDALVEVLRAAKNVRALSALPSENAFDTFERIGTEFQSDTGLLRPGKDAGLIANEDEGERAKRFAEWRTERIAALDRTLAAPELADLLKEIGDAKEI